MTLTEHARPSPSAAPHGATPIAGWRRTQSTFQAPHTTGNTSMGAIGSARSGTYSSPAITRRR